MLIFRSSLLLPFLAVVSLEHQASCKAGQEWKFPSDYPARHHATALVSVDPRNVVTTTELDDWERPTRVTVTGGETPLEEWFEYDAVGRLRSHRRRQGAEIVTSEFRYDAMHRRIESSTDNAQVGGATATVKSTTNYQISARRIVATLTGGATVTTTLDRLGRIESRRTETGHSPIDALFAYDASDNPVYNSDRLTASAMAFDIHGRLVGTLYSDGTSEKGADPYQRTLAYNNAGQNTASTLGDLAWERAYDELGNLTAAADPARPETTNSYDSRGVVTTTKLPGDAEQRYQWDASGALKSFTDPDSETTGAVTDLLGRPLSRTYPDGTVETIEYEGGRIKSVTRSDGRPVALE